MTDMNRLTAPPSGTNTAHIESTGCAATWRRWSLIVYLRPDDRVGAWANVERQMVRSGRTSWRRWSSLRTRFRTTNCRWPGLRNRCGCSLTRTCRRGSRPGCAGQGTMRCTLPLLRSADHLTPDQQATLLIANLPAVASDLDSGAAVSIARGRLRPPLGAGNSRSITPAGAAPAEHVFLLLSRDSWFWQRILPVLSRPTTAAY